MNRLEEIRERCEKATLGPWLIKHQSGSLWAVKSKSSVRAVCYCTEDDARFIANSREDIPYLLDLLAERDREIERLQSLAFSEPAYMTSTIGDLTIDSEGTRKAVDSLKRAENEVKRLRKALWDMLFAYVNKDPDFPHQFETEALKQAAELIGEPPEKGE